MRNHLLSILGLALCISSVRADDWPMWRFNAQRGASTPHELAAKLHVQWTRKFQPPQTAWPSSQGKLQFDAVPQAVVMAKRIFVPSTVNDTVTAYSTETGSELWRFYANAPVRFAPIAHDGKVYFASDDGYLYCVLADNGRLQWKLNGGPAERWIIGNHRLTSSWPCRGGPVLHEGKIYFTASIWPFMGIFIHAVDPNTGKIVWTNSGDGTNFMTHPHGAKSFGTVVPQGHLAATGDFLIVPGGRSTPAVYDVHTGKLLQFKFDGRRGGHHVMAGSGNYFIDGQAYHAPTGKNLGSVNPMLADDKRMYFNESSSTVRIDDANAQIKKVTKKDRKGKKVTTTELVRKQLATLKLNGKETLFVRAGSRVYTGTTGNIAAYSIAGNRREWTATIDGKPAYMIAADDRLFVMTTDAKLYCFGVQKTEVKRHEIVTRVLDKVKSVSGEELAAILKKQKINSGFAVVAGIDRGDLIQKLIEDTDMFVIGIDSDETTIDKLRREMDDAGYYGKRVSLYVGDPATFALPPYLANLIIKEPRAGKKTGLKNNDARLIENLYHALRPYGGLMYFPSRNTLAAIVSKSKTIDGKLVRVGDSTILSREGPLPNTDMWTHQYGNAAQTAVSKDKTVKAPLGLLWFGGPSHDNILPRHGHGPSPQVAGGRLVIEGPDMLRAMDIYTGRVLWEHKLPQIGKYYNTTRHFPGAGEIGSNYVTLPDNVYAVYGASIIALDAATGKQTRTFQLPSEKGKEPPFFGFLAVSGDYIITTSSPIAVKISGKTVASKAPKDATPIIKRHATWQYLTMKDPPDNWTELSFKTKGWKKGKAGFGFGDGDDKTTLKIHNKFQRVYIRHEFDGKGLDAKNEIGLAISFDDAFIAYLNGKEILRVGVGRGRGAKASKFSGHEAGTYEYFVIKDAHKLLRPGKNVLALEGHNSSKDSSDMSLDPYLVIRGSAKKVVKKDPPQKSSPDLSKLPTGRYASGSRVMAVFDRKTGDLLWTREAKFNFRHNNIAVAGGKVFCIDSLTDARKSALARRGLKLQGKPTLYALDVRDGDVLWSTHENVFGTFLNYSANYDVLLQAGSRYRDRASDESSKGMVAYRGADGKVLWKNLSLSHGGPCLLWRDKIITNGSGGASLELLTGKATGWKYKRMYGCNTAVGSEFLLTFRSGSAGFFDLAEDSGTGNIGGFRSSCTNNLIVADGVLNAPDYTRTCSCAYQNQTSLGLIHMPNAEFWTFGGKQEKGRIGINLAAPGDRRAPNSTLWRNKGAKIEPENSEEFRFHSAFVKAGKLPWVSGNGLKGVTRITIPVSGSKKQRMKLYFLEPDSIKSGERVFDVKVNGQTVFEKLDVVQMAGGAHRELVRELDVDVNGENLVIELQARTKRSPILSGVEVVIAK